MRIPSSVPRLVIISILAIAACIALLPSSSHARGQDPASSGALERIGPGVVESIDSGEGAQVVVALARPAAAAARRPDLPTLRSEIAAMRQDVLSGLAPSDFRSRRTFQAVPALAGRVLTRTGLMKLASHPLVQRIDLDVGGEGQLAISVPLISADQRHAQGNTGGGVVVAVMDTGIDTDHADLADDLLHEECFLDRDGAINGVGDCPNGSDRQSGPGAAEDDAGHGTHVTGIVTSNGSLAPVGAAPDAGIVSIKVMAGPSFGGTFSFFSELIAGWDFILNNPQLNIKIVNMSLGTFALFPGDCDGSTAFNMAGAAAVSALRASGVIVFASAGNNGSGGLMTSPACLSQVVSVGASDDFDNVAPFSNSNSSTDIFAPGVTVLSSGRNDTTIVASGTSMASPTAAGCAALLVESGEALTPDAIEARLKISPVLVTDSTNGLSFPRIDCRPGTPIVLRKSILSGPDRPMATPTSITFETLTTSCASPPSTLQYFLNGVFLGSQAANPGLNCSCGGPLQAFHASNAALISSAWNDGGVNQLRVVKGGANNSAIAWTRATVGARSVCIGDVNGGDCDMLDLCAAGYTFGPLDVSGLVHPGDGVVDLVVEVGQTVPTSYEFGITYQAGGIGPVLVTDTVPSEWQAELVNDDGGRATAESAGRGPAHTSSTKINWYPEETGGDVRARATSDGPTRQGLYAPNSCGTLLLNTGARAYELDPVKGHPLEDDQGNWLPPVASSERLCLAAVSDVNGDGDIAADGSGDEDGDGLSDLAEACTFGTDPCLLDSDGDGYTDGEETQAGSDPLSPESVPI